MKPEAAAFLTKGQEFLERAPALLAQNFIDDAGRCAYLAGFHAAQALLFEKLGRSPKRTAEFKRDLQAWYGTSQAWTSN